MIIMIPAAYTDLYATCNNLFDKTRPSFGSICADFIFLMYNQIYK